MTNLRRSSTVVVSILALALGAAACTPPGPARTSTVESVDIERYLGTWYEIASTKQFFSVGLVNSTAEYSLLPDGSVRVLNSGRYFGPEGPPVVIEGTAVPVDDSNARLNVSFTGSNSAMPPGNYWIVDLDPDYQWAIVSDSSGRSGFFLSRTPTVSDEFRAELYDRAAAKGVVTSTITETPQL